MPATMRPIQWILLAFLAAAALPLHAASARHHCTLGFLSANNMGHFLRHNKCCIPDRPEDLDLSPFIQLLERLRGHRLLFLGDSTQQQSFEAFAGLLNIGGIHYIPRDASDARSEVHEIHVPSYNLTVTGHLSYFFFPPDATKQRHYSAAELGERRPGFGIKPIDRNSLTFDLAKRAIEGSTMAVLNLGFHYAYAGLVQAAEGAAAAGGIEPAAAPVTPVHPAVFQQLVYFYIDMLDKDMASDARKRHFFRYTFPQQYSQEFALERGYSMDGDIQGQNYKERSRNIKCARSGATLRHWTDAMAHEIVEGTRVIPLDMFRWIASNKRLVYKADGGEKGDCTHVCWSSAMWLHMFGDLMLPRLQGR